MLCTLLLFEISKEFGGIYGSNLWKTTQKIPIIIASEITITFEEP